MVISDQKHWKWHLRKFSAWRVQRWDSIAISFAWWSVVRHRVDGWHLEATHDVALVGSSLPVQGLPWKLCVNGTARAPCMSSRRFVHRPPCLRRAERCCLLTEIVLWYKHEIKALLFHFVRREIYFSKTIFFQARFYLTTQHIAANLHSCSMGCCDGVVPRVWTSTFFISHFFNFSIFVCEFLGTVHFDFSFFNVFLLNKIISVVIFF